MCNLAPTPYCAHSGATASSSSSSSSSSDKEDGKPPTTKQAKSNSKDSKKGRGSSEAVGRVGWGGRAGKLARIAQHEAAEAARLLALLEGNASQGAAQGVTEHKGKGGKDAAQPEAKKKERIVVTLDIPEDPRIKVCRRKNREGVYRF
jgi:hypothetical protein